MFVSPTLIRRFGERRLLLVVLGVYGLRMAGYALLPLAPSPTWVLLIEPAHGVTFALFYTSSVSLAAKLAPPGFEARARKSHSRTDSNRRRRKEIR